MGDFSCYIKIKNDLDVSLTYVNRGLTEGYWNVAPPDTIAANSTSSQFQTKDNWGAYGSGGWVAYSVNLKDAPDDDRKPVITVIFDCPTGNNDNYLDANFRIRADTSSAKSHLFTYSTTSYKKRDHPLTGTIAISYNSALTTNSKVSTVNVPNPVTAVRNTKGEVHKSSNLEVWNTISSSKYDDDTYHSIAGSYYPVAFDLSDNQLPKIDIYFNVDENMLGVPLDISGSIGSDSNVINSTDVVFFWTTGKETKVRLQVGPSWAQTSTPWGISGDVVWKWKVRVTPQVLKIDTTRLEFYAVNKSLPSFFKKEIFVNLPRAIVLPVRGRTNWVNHVCAATFTDFKFEFDADDGAAAYAQSKKGGNFKLSDYLSDIGESDEVNSYDQAGIVQICLGLTPTRSDAAWVYMKKFGFTKTLPLVGRGDCNNPFYLNSDYNSKKICDNNATDRSYLSDEAIISLNGKIIDTCLGPAKGTDTLADYLAHSIQTETETTLYQSTSTKPATKDDAVTSYKGVSSLTYPTATVSTLLPMPAMDKEIKEAMQKAIPATPVVIQQSSANIPEFFSKGKFKIVRQSIEATQFGTFASWVLSSGPQRRVVQISVLPDHQTAVDCFADHLTSYNMPLNRVFSSVKPGAQKGQLSLQSNASKHRGIIIWVWGNIFVRVFGSVPTAELDEYLASVLHKKISSAAVPVKQAPLPKIGKVSLPEDKVRLGEQFIVQVEDVGSEYSNVQNETGVSALPKILDRLDTKTISKNVIFLQADETRTRFSFLASSRGKDRLFFCFAHKETLNSVSKSIEIEVVE
ncbi:hypothetical protein MMC17_009353 [Xylographa soralifera]|nr:hypothetical protein [Xylographa soralifera]